MKKKNLKSNQKKEKDSLQRSDSYMAHDVSTERMETKRKLNDAFTILKENHFQYTVVYSI